MLRCGAAIVMARASQLPASARPDRQQRLQAQPAGVRLEADALQRADRIAERQHVGAVRAVGTQRAHDEQDGAAGIAALGGLRKIGQHAGLGQVAARRLRRAARRIPQRRSARRCRAHRARSPSRCSACGAEAAAQRPSSSIGRRRRQAPAAPLRIGDVDQRQPVPQAGCSPPSARRVELAGRQRDLDRRLANLAELRRRPHARRAAAPRMRAVCRNEPRAARIVEDARRTCAPAVPARAPARWPGRSRARRSSGSRLAPSDRPAALPDSRGGDTARPRPPASAR